MGCPKWEATKDVIDSIWGEVTDKSTRGATIRLGLGMHSKLNGLPEGGYKDAFFQMIREEVGVDVRTAPVDIQTLTRIRGRINFLGQQSEMIVDRGRKLIGKYGSVENIPESESLWPKTALLRMTTPESHFYGRIPGGHQIFKDVSFLQERNKNQVDTVSNKLESIVRNIEKAVSETAEEQLVNVSEMESTMGKDQAIIEALKKRGGESNGLSPVERAELSQARARRDQMEVLVKQAKSKGSDQRAVVLSNEVVRYLKTVGEKNKRGVLAEIKREHGFKELSVLSVADGMSDLLRKMNEINNETNTIGRENIEIMMDGSGMDPVEVKAMAEKIFDYKEIRDGYFPKDIAGQSAITTQTVGEVLSMPVMSKENMSEVLMSLTNRNMAHRSESGPEVISSANPIATLVDYSQHLLHTNYLNKIANVTGKHGRAMKDIVAGDQMNGENLRAYLKVMNAMVNKQLVGEAVGTADHGIGADLSRTLMSLNAGLTLSLSPPTSLRNKFGGKYLGVALMGNQQIKEADNLLGNEEFATRVTKHLASEQIDVLTSTLIGTGEMNKALMSDIISRVPGLSGEALLQVVKESRLEMATRKMADGAGKLADWGLSKGGALAYKNVENGLRQTVAHRAAALELDLIEREYLPQFKENKVPKDVIRKYHLNEEAIKEGEWEGEWNKYAKERLASKMYEKVLGSQFLYNQMQRHPIEKVKIGTFRLGSYMQMFTHYPVSWQTNLYIHTRELMSEKQAAKGDKEAMKDNPHERFIKTSAKMMGADYVMSHIPGFNFYGLGMLPAVATAVAALTGLAGGDEKEELPGGAIGEFTGIGASDMVDATELVLNTAPFLSATGSEKMIEAMDLAVGMDLTDEERGYMAMLKGGAEIVARKNNTARLGMAIYRDFNNGPRHALKATTGFDWKPWVMKETAVKAKGKFNEVVHGITPAQAKADSTAQERFEEKRNKSRNP